MNNVILENKARSRLVEYCFSWANSNNLFLNEIFVRKGYICVRSKDTVLAITYKTYLPDMVLWREVTQKHKKVVEYTPLDRYDVVFDCGCVETITREHALYDNVVAYYSVNSRVYNAGKYCDWCKEIANAREAE